MSVTRTVSYTHLDVYKRQIETRSSWIFPQPPKSIPLLPLMLFKRGYWNTFYAVRVKPSHDLIAQIQLAAQ